MSQPCRIGPQRVVHEQGVTVTRTISRIVPLALAIMAFAVPAANARPDNSDAAVQPAAISKVTPDARDAGLHVAAVDRVSPDAHDAGLPVAAVDRVSPDARDNGRREPAPVVLAQPAVSATDGFDWTDAVIGAAGFAGLTLLLGGSAMTLRHRRGPVGAA